LFDLPGSAKAGRGDPSFGLTDKHGGGEKQKRTVEKGEDTKDGGPNIFCNNERTREQGKT